MSYVTACLLVVLSALAAAAGSWVVSRTLHPDTRRRHHEVGNPVFLQLGVMFAVLLAFVFSEVWSEYNEAAQAINGECGALHGAAMLARDLPPGQGQAVDRAILTYARTVVDVEWRSLRRRRSSPLAVRAFESVIDAAARVDVSRSVDVSEQAQVMSLVMQAHAFRETRIFQADQGLPTFIWLVLCLYSAVLIWFVLMAGVESRAAHMLFAGMFAASIVLVLVLMKMLDYPFEGALTLAKADFVTLIGRVSALPGGGA